MDRHEQINQSMPEASQPHADAGRCWAETMVSSLPAALSQQALADAGIYEKLPGHPPGESITLHISLIISNIRALSFCHLGLRVITPLPVPLGLRRSLLPLSAGSLLPSSVAGPS
jgi:hypothetical protein